MSVASEASQIRGPGAPSNDWRLGRPITTPSPEQTATDAGDTHQSQAQRSGSSHGDAVVQSLPPAQMLPLAAQVLSELTPRQQQRMLLRSDASVSSTRRAASPATPVHHKTLLHSCRCLLAQIQDLATEPDLLPCAVPYRKNHPANRHPQDVVRVALTIRTPL
jgi:hypothetical protein